MHGWPRAKSVTDILLDPGLLLICACDSSATCEVSLASSMAWTLYSTCVKDESDCDLRGVQIMEYVLSIAAIARGWSGYLATLCNHVISTICFRPNERFHK